MQLEYLITEDKKRLITNFPEMQYHAGVKMKLKNYFPEKGSMFEVIDSTATIDAAHLEIAYKQYCNKPFFTLAEYQAQINPVKMPIVLLQENEYRVELRYMHRGTIPCADIIINAYPNAWYIQKGDCYQLQAINNGKNIGNSCFWLPKTENTK